MIYLVSSDYRIDRNAHMLIVKRADPRSHDMQILVPTWKTVQPGEAYGDDVTYLHDQEFQALMRDPMNMICRAGYLYGMATRLPDGDDRTMLMRASPSLSFAAKALAKT